MDLTPTQALWLANFVRLVHLMVVLFIVAGLCLIWVGHYRGWHWIRNGIFRLLHLLAMGLVAVQTILGRACPLTVWEWELRRLAGRGGDDPGGFIEYWTERILFFDLHPAFFAVLYILFFVVIIWTYWKIPPRPLRRPR